jgi:hypothetical protein
MVIEMSTENVVNNAVASQQPNARSEVIRSNCTLYHHWDVRTIDNTCVIELRAFVTKKHVVKLSITPRSTTKNITALGNVFEL